MSYNPTENYALNKKFYSITSRECLKAAIYGA